MRRRRTLITTLAVTAAAVISVYAAIRIDKGPVTSQITPHSTGIYTMA
jgi:hypothetical protein